MFEKKIQDEDAWRIYKRAYKKYYARLMKGTMSQEDFKAWTDQAAADRDAALTKLKCVSDAMLTTQIIERLRKQLNRK